VFKKRTVSVGEGWYFRRLEWKLLRLFIGGNAQEKFVKTTLEK